MRALFRDEGGFTQVGVVVALLLALALLTTSVQVYRVNAEAGEIQFSADAGALAAENVVGEYYLIARGVDAAVLSLSLFALTVYVVAFIATVVPGGQAVGARLLEVGRRVADFRHSFSRTCSRALEATEKALPFLAAIDSAKVVSQNSTQHSTYYGFALILPLTGESDFPEDDADEALEELDEDAGNVHEQSDEALEAVETMKDAKHRAYMADCGSSPGYCQYERASKLAGGSVAYNPYYASEDLWQFEVALDRARAYYAVRLQQESPESYGDDEIGESVARKALYAYEVEQLQGAYVSLDEQGVLHASFPELPHNSDQVRESPLYTARSYPVSSDGVLHASEGCSAFQASFGTGYGSVADAESGLYGTCPACEFSTSTLGRTAAISHNAENGFEYHYEIIAQEARRYAEASRTYEAETRESRDAISDAIDTFKKAVDALLSDDARIVPKPPGRAGCVSVAVDMTSHAVSSEYPLPFVESDAVLQGRMAISAAQLVDEDATSDETFLTDMLDGFAAQTEGGDSVAALIAGSDVALTLWSGSLTVYGQGIEGFSNGIEQAIDSIPLVGSTPLGSWAKSKFLEEVDDLGFTPPDLGSPKAATVNTTHVLEAAGFSIDDVLSDVPGFGDSLSDAFDETGLGTLGFISEALCEMAGADAEVGWS